MTAAVRGLVLAGGDSRRMGTDKAGLELDGSTLLERGVALLSEVVADVHVSVRDTDALRSHYVCISDSVDIRGPAAGMLSAHRLFPDEAWLVLACDMPLVSHSILSRLLENRDPEAAATCWLGADGRPEPLCAVYDPATLAAFLRHINAGGNAGPRGWLIKQQARMLELPESTALSSANTPQEWQTLRKEHE